MKRKTRFRIWRRDYGPTRQFPTEDVYEDINVAIRTASQMTRELTILGKSGMYFPYPERKAPNGFGRREFYRRDPKERKEGN